MNSLTPPLARPRSFRFRSGIAALVIGMLAALVIPAQPAEAQGGLDQVAINEIFYHPPCLAAFLPCPDAPAEFIELVNFGTSTVDLGGWEFVDGVDYQFPAGVNLAAGDFVVVAGDLSGFLSYFGRSALGQWSGGLSNGGERIALANSVGSIIDEVTYSDGADTPGAWAVGADGNGDSLSLSSAADDDGASWWWEGVTPTPARVNTNNGAAPSAIVENFTWTRLPAANESLQISADVYNGSNVSFQFRVGYPGTVRTVPMTKGAGDRWTGSIDSSGYHAGELVRLRLLNGGTVIAPRADDTIDWVGTTVADPGVNSNLPVIEWFTSNTNYNAGYNEQGSTMYDGVLAFNGEVWDNTEFRIRGAIARSSTWTKRNWKFKFPQHHNFTIDGIDYAIDTLDLQGGFADEARIREYVGHTVAAEMGLVASQVQHVRVQLNGEFFGLHTLQEHPEGGFLKDNGLPNATLFRQVRSPFYESGPTGIGVPSSVGFENWDIPEYVNLLAAASVIQNNDFAHGNFYFWYDADEHQRYEGMIWDLDLSQGIRYAPNAGLTTRLENGSTWSYVWHRWKNQAPYFNQGLSAPYRELYLRRLRTLADEWFATGRYEQVAREAFADIGADWNLDVNRWGFWGGQNFSQQGAIDRMADTWIDQYYAHILAGGPNGDIPGPQPANPNVALIVEAAPGDSRAEHIRIQNNENTAIDISGWQINGSTTLTLPPGSVLPRNGSAYVVGNDRANGFRAVTSNAYVLGEYSAPLNDAGGSVELMKPNGQVRASAIWGAGAPSPGLILNEWNAVSSTNLITGGDTYFGSVPGNGGDWFELVVVEDHLDVRGWQLELTDSDSGVAEVTDTFTFSNRPLLADLRAGTIITVSEDLGDNVSFSPRDDDWWINLQSETGDSGSYFTAATQSNFNTDNDDWQLRIIDDTGATRFGPAGEGIGVASGVSSTEVGELEDDPSDQISGLSLYDDGNDSTFGSPNGFDAGFQDFSVLRDWYVFVDPSVPFTTVETPAQGAELSDSLVLISGSTNDDLGVARVRVSVRDTTSGLYLRPNGSFGAAESFRDAQLDSPNAALTDWSLSVTLPAGSYELSAIGVDTDAQSEIAVKRSFVVRDTEPPSRPTNLSVLNQTASSIELSWSEASDDVGVQSYEVYRDGAVVALVNHPATTFTDEGLASSTSFTYRVSALDGAGNVSALSPTLVTTTRAFAGPFTAIAFGDEWSYLDNGSNQGSAWRQSDFDDSAWAVGAGELGYGDGDEATVVGFGPNASQKYVTTYFRRSFVAPSGVESVQIDMIRDDGAVVYLNGVQIASDNMANVVDYQTLATTPLAPPAEATPVSFVIPANALQAGTNVIAVEVHQSSVTSSDLSFDLELSGVAADLDTADPVTVVSSPGSDEVLVDGAVLIEGSSSDDVGVSRVRVAVEDTDTGLWLQPDGSFDTTQRWRVATLASPGAATTDWSAAVVLPDGAYSVSVRANDAADNTETTIQRSFEVLTSVVDVTAPVAVIVAPAEGEVVGDGAVVLSGSSSDDVGVSRVRVAVKDIASDLWLQPDGSFAETWANSAAVLDSPDAVESEWSFAVSLPDGLYRARVTAFDAAGNTQSSVRRDFEVSAEVADIDAPVTVVSSPGADEVLVDGAVLIEGSSTDDVGVSRVRVAVRDLGSGLWLQPDGSFAATWSGPSAVLASPDGAETDWSYAVSLPDGLYRAFVTANDAADNTETTIQRSFEVLTSVVDVTAPVAVIVAPAEGEVVGDGAVVLSGSSSDDVGVSRVRVAVKDIASDLWLQPDGSFAETWANSAAVLDSPDAVESEWSFAVSLPDGLYRARVTAFDAAGNTQSSVRRDFEVSAEVADIDAPVTVVSSPGADEVLVDGAVLIEGSSTDDVGVSRVRVAVRDLGSGLWLQPDGSFAATWSGPSAVLASPDGAETDWSYAVSLPDGLYRAFVTANDAADNTETTIQRSFEVLTSVVDVTAPVAVIVAPAEGEVVGDGAVVLSGSSSDDVGVSRVRVAVKDIASDLWLQPDGSFAETWANSAAVLDSPDAVESEWSFAVSLPDGLYRARVTAFDAAGNTQSSVRRDFEVSAEVADIDAPVTVVSSPGADEVLVDGAVLIEGSSTDDVGVSRVRVAVRDLGSGLWLQPDGSFAATWSGPSAVLASPDGAETDWSYAVSLPDGLYRAFVTANDAADNTETTIQRSFEVLVAG